MSELKPCLCGSSVKYSRYSKPIEGLEPKVWHFIECQNTAACGYQRSKIDEPKSDAIITEWNHRPIEDALTAQIKQLSAWALEMEKQLHERERENHE